MIKFVKENKISKNWRAMKFTIDFENGMVLSMKLENLMLVDNEQKNTALVTKTDNTVIPLVFFPLLLATPAELKAREEVKKTAQAAQAQADAVAATARAAAAARVAAVVTQPPALPVE